MKKVLIASTLVLFGLAACQNASEAKDKEKETAEEMEANQAKVAKLEEETSKFERARADIDTIGAELDSLINDL